MTVEDGVAVVTKVEARRVTKARPVPMSTVEMQKRRVGLDCETNKRVYLVCKSNGARTSGVQLWRREPLIEVHRGYAD